MWCPMGIKITRQDIQGCKIDHNLVVKRLKTCFAMMLGYGVLMPCLNVK